MPGAGQVVATSGGAGVTVGLIKKAGIPFYTEGSPGFARDSSRIAPYNLFANLQDVATEAKLDEPARPANYLPWGSEKDFPKGQPAKTIAATFGGGHTTNWTYDGKGYVNQNSYAAPGDTFPAAELISFVRPKRRIALLIYSDKTSPIPTPKKLD